MSLSSQSYLTLIVFTVQQHTNLQPASDGEDRLVSAVTSCHCSCRKLSVQAVVLPESRPSKPRDPQLLHPSLSSTVPAPHNHHTLICQNIVKLWTSPAFSDCRPRNINLWQVILTLIIHPGRQPSTLWRQCSAPQSSSFSWILIASLSLWDMNKR